MNAGEGKPGGRAKAIVDGSVSAASLGLAMGVSCDANGEGEESRAVVTHDVGVTGAAAWGVGQEARDYHFEYERLPVSEVSVGGNVEVCSRCDIARGIHSYADGTMSCRVGGSVSVVNENRGDERWRSRSKKYPVDELLDGYKGLAPGSEEYRSGCAFGIQVTNWGRTSVSVRGDVRATSSFGDRCGCATGVEVGSFCGATRIVVGGSIVACAEDEDGFGDEAKGVYVWRHDGGDVFVRAGGVVAQGADPDTVGISAYSTSESEIPTRIEVQVLGDVTSSGSGIMLSSICRSLAAPSLVVLVDGTIRAGVHGVCVGRREEHRYDEATDSHISLCAGEPWGSVDVVVWRIVAGEGRMAVQADEGVDRCVSYIVRVEQPAGGAAIRILSNLGQKAFRDVSHAFRVAHAGDVIRFAVDVPEGWQPTAVYGLQDGEPLMPEPDGTYRVTVPPEGGVCLRAV